MREGKKISDDNEGREKEISFSILMAYMMQRDMYTYMKEKEDDKEVVERFLSFFFGCCTRMNKKTLQINTSFVFKANANKKFLSYVNIELCTFSFCFRHATRHLTVQSKEKNNESK